MRCGLSFLVDPCLLLGLAHNEKEETSQATLGGTKHEGLLIVAQFLLCLNRRVKPLKSSKPELLDWSISFSIVSPYIRGFKFRNAGSFCLWNPESGVVESGIRQAGISLTIGI